MDKRYLREQLQTVKNNYALLQAGILFLAQPGARSDFDRYFQPIAAHPEASSIQYIRYVLESDALLKHATSQLRGTVLRSCLKEAYELVLAYARRSHQLDRVHSAAWYEFLRMVRNCLSHDFRLSFRTGDLKRLPVSWSGITLDAGMQHEQLPDAFNRGAALALLDAVIAHVDDRLA